MSVPSSALKFVNLPRVFWNFLKSYLMASFIYTMFWLTPWRGAYGIFAIMVFFLTPFTDFEDTVHSYNHDSIFFLRRASVFLLWMVPFIIFYRRDYQKSRNFIDKNPQKKIDIFSLLIKSYLPVSFLYTVLILGTYLTEYLPFIRPLDFHDKLWNPNHTWEFLLFPFIPPVELWNYLWQRQEYRFPYTAGHFLGWFIPWLILFSILVFRKWRKLHAT